MASAQAKTEPTANRRSWATKIAKAQRDFQSFQKSGCEVVDQYRIESKSSTQQDKYNILYSITETIKPSMYSQTPKAEVRRRQVERSNPVVLAGTLLMEAALQYTIEDQDFDEIMNSAVEDFLLPGLGIVWCRYEPTIVQVPAMDYSQEPPVPLVKDGKPQTNPEIKYEKVVFDYVLWQDFLCSRARCWAEVKWIARRVYLDKSEFKKQFPKIPLSKIKFVSKPSTPASSNDNQSIAEQQVPVWEIWDKTTHTVIWFTDCYEDDILKVEDDILRLKDFFPVPRPLRAVKTNNKFIPRPFFCQYQAQADELNDITYRIRRLARALKAVGIYDQSVPALQNLLKGDDNRMIPVDNWSVVQDKGGIKGTVDFLPITEIANVLMQLYDARERIKGEIYEITGWSDIIRGVSKASETLGAQQIKAEWAGARLKLLQKDVQRFVRDLLRIAGEIIAEHFQPEMLLSIAGIDPKENPEDWAKLQPIFSSVLELLRTEKDRCALIEVETDSTLAPDEANDKKERMEFVSSVGAFLQQAIPAAQQTPALAPVLGEVLMLAVRGFRGARNLEGTFETFVQQMAQQPPQQQGKEGGDGGASAQASAQAKIADTQAKTGIAQAEIAEEQRQHTVDTELERQKEQNRHAEKMLELDIRNREAVIKERELGIKANEAMATQLNTETDRALGEQARQEDRADRAEERAQAAQGNESA